MGISILRRSIVVSGMTFFVLGAVLTTPAAATATTTRDRRAFVSQKRSNSLETMAAPARPQLRRWELRTAPIAMLASWYTLDVAYRISDRWATGPAAVLYNGAEQGNMLYLSRRGHAFGWNGTYYLRSATTDSWYLNTHAYYESSRAYPHAVSGYNEENGVRANLTVGYHKRRWKQINLMMGVGAELRNYDVTKYRESSLFKPESEESSHEVTWVPHIEFKVVFEI